MGVLEIIAESRIGIEQLASHPLLRAALVQADRSSRSPKLTSDEKSRIESLVELCFEYERETDPAEKANILRTLEEISANEPLELPTTTADEWDAELKATQPDYAAVSDAQAQRLAAFRKIYFSLRAKAGLKTQADVAKKSGLRRSYISIIENGDHFPQQKTLQKLAQAFGVDVGDLLP
jgi:DNA-binding XRE family transcriptional regulator